MWNHKQQDNYKACPLVIITDIKRGGHNLFIPNPWSVKIVWSGFNVTSLSNKQKKDEHKANCFNCMCKY